MSPLLAITLPPHPAAAEFVLPLIGNDPAGGELEGASARVVATADAIADGGDELRFIASATADANGRARIWLVPGELALNRLYRVDVVTPAGSPLGSRWSAEVAVAAPGVLPRFVLPSRTYVAGRVVGHDGIAVPGTSVHPRISFRSAAALTPDQRLRVGQQAVEPVPVDDDGGFAAYLDPSLDGQPLVYDLDVTPPQNSLSPRWSYDEVVTFDPVTTPGLSYAELPAWTLPAASFARALVVDAAGVAVPGAELRVFTTGTPDECLGLAAGCVSPARLRALTAAGADGQVRRLALPDPRPAPAP